MCRSWHDTSHAEDTANRPGDERLAYPRSVTSTPEAASSDRARADLAAYDTFGYDNVAFRATHADWLTAYAALLGVQVVDLDTVRILELGCGRGGNLVAMADDLPHARCVGVDHAPSQVADGRDFAARAEVTNCTFIAADLVDVATDPALLGDTATFDVIVCHGVYSWVPDEVRHAIRSIVRSRLAPDGVAMVSFNTLPGWHARRIVRDALRRVVPEGSPAEMAATARGFVQMWAEHGDDSGPLAAFMRHEFDLLDRLSDRYLFFEHLVEHNRAFYLDEVVADMAAAGLRYLGDADPGTSNPAQLDADGAAAVIGLGLDAVGTEQILDLFTTRFFRRSLFCRDDATLGDGGTEAVSGLRVGADLELISADVTLDAVDPAGSEISASFRDTDGATLSPHDATTATMLWVLSDARPDTVAVDALVDDVARRRSVPVDDVRDDVCTVATELIMRGRLDAGRRVRHIATEVAATPIARRLARVQALAGEPVITTARHDHLAVDTLDRVLLRAMDGTVDRQGFVTLAFAAMETGELTITSADGDPVTDQDSVGELVDAKLERFRIAGVLMRQHGR